MREHWGSKVGFVLAALGSAIGLGTLWKFPYVVGDNGGGVFLLFYTFFTLTLGIPLFIGELIIGRRTQRGAVGSFASLAGQSSPWRVVGWFGVLSAFFILSYYCIVAGWGLNYLMLSLNQFYEIRSSAQIASTFGRLYEAGDVSLFWGTIFLLLTFGVVYQGIRKGIEQWSRILMVLLLLLLVALCIYSFTLSGFSEALQFLFRFKWRELQYSGILQALGLSLFTLSLAQGVIITYGSYLPPNSDLPKAALIVGIAVVLISFLTVLVIYPVVFTFHLPINEGAGLIFETMPVLFASLPGAMVLSVLFFTLFVFAALTSSIALLEVVVANLIDLYGLSRPKAAIFSSVALFFVSIPCALAGSGALFKEWLPMYGVNFFGTLDALVSNWLLPLGALLTSLFLGWRLPSCLVREEFKRGSIFGKIYGGWIFLIRWIVPMAILLVFIYESKIYSFDK